MTKDYGFVYIWRDRKKNRYYVGCHWGNENDGYVCSSTWMKQAYYSRPEDFKRRIIKRMYTSFADLIIEEYRYLQMIKQTELGRRYYNKRNTNEHWRSDEFKLLTVAEKVSKANKGRKHNFTPEYLAERGKRISETKAKRNEERRAAGLPVRAKETKKRKQRPPQTPEARAARSAGLKRAYAEGRRSINTSNKTQVN